MPFPERVGTMLELLKNKEYKQVIDQFVNDDYKEESSLMRGHYLGDDLAGDEDYAQLCNNLKKAFRG